MQYLKKTGVLLFSIILACSISIVNANGEDYRVFKGGKTHAAQAQAKSCKSHSIKKKTKKQSIPLKRTKVHHPIKKHVKKRVCFKKGSAKKQSIASNQTPLPRESEETIEGFHNQGKDSCKGSSCNEYPIVRKCARLPKRIVNCERVNPSDLIENTCKDFSDKLKNCEAYSCQAAYTQDPSIKTKWEIVQKSGDRCIVSSTTEDVGIKDINDNPLPITQKCEYDETGIQGLILRLKDNQDRYYHFTTCQHFEGIYNCSVKSRGLSIQDAIKNPSDN